MYVLIGRTHLENHEIVQMRYALEDREAVLKKAINAAENARLPTQAGSADLETCKRLAALLDPTSHDAEETRRTQYDAFEQHPSQPADEALAEAEKEAARLRQHEIDRALRAILFDGVSALEDMEEDELAAFRNQPDDELTADVERCFARTSYRDEEHPELSGVYRHERECGLTAWCYASADGGVLRFWYDVQLFGDDHQRIVFDEKNTPATYVGEALLARIRRAFAAEPEVRKDEVASEDSDSNPVAAWARETRPQPTIRDGTGVVAQALHTAIFERAEDVPAQLYAARESGISDLALGNLLLLAFTNRAPEGREDRYGWSEPVARGDGHMDYVAVDIRMPDGGETTLAVKGKGTSLKQKVKLPELVKITRGMLALPEAADEPLDVVQPEDEPAAETAGV